MKNPRSSYLPFGRPDFGDEEVAAVTRVLRSGWIGMGPETLAFEAELAQALRADHVVAVSSCTSAMLLALRVLGLRPGDEVICPSLTWCSTANAALYLGAVPVFCDVDPSGFCVTPDRILERVTKRTRAVMVVHFGGRTVDVAELRSALPASIPIVEDAAHALGGRYPDGGPVGSSGNMVCFSFYANKNLSTGEGGAVALADGDQADRIRSLRQHALPVDAWKRFTHSQTVIYSQKLTELGYKANYTDLQAAIGRVQLRRQGEMSARRRQLADRYLERLTLLSPWIVPQGGLADASHALHLFPVLIRSTERRARDEVLIELRRRNIGASVHYAPLHLMPLYHHGQPQCLPVTASVCAEILTLPFSASMSVADVDEVCDHLAELAE